MCVCVCVCVCVCSGMSYYLQLFVASYAFALEQTNQRDRAEELARKALGLQKKTSTTPSGSLVWCVCGCV